MSFCSGAQAKFGCILQMGVSKSTDFLLKSWGASCTFVQLAPAMGGDGNKHFLKLLILCSFRSHDISNLPSPPTGEM